MNFVKYAAIYAKIVYIIAYTKKDVSKAENASIKYTAKKVAATRIGHFIIFCSTTARIIVAIGSAKYSNKFILNSFLSLSIYYII